MKPRFWPPLAHEHDIRRTVLASRKIHPTSPFNEKGLTAWWTSYILVQGCFIFISGLSAQASLKRLLPGAKVMFFLPWEANSFLRSTGVSISKDHNWLRGELDPALRPVLLGSGSIGSDDTFLKICIICQHLKIRSFHMQFFSFSWKLESPGNTQPTFLQGHNQLQLSGGWSL